MRFDRSSTALLSNLTLGLLLLLIVHAVLLPVAVHRVEPGVPSPANQMPRFIARSQSADSWEPMAAAETYASGHRGVSLYEEVFFRQRTKFMYPPTSLLFVRTLSRRTLNALSWSAVWVTVVLTLLLFFRGTRASGGPHLAPSGRLDAGVRAAVVLALALTFYPLLRAYTLGQIQVWLDAVFALFVAAWWLGRRFAAGMALGVLCLIKPPFALIGIWAAARRDSRLVAGAVVVAAAGVAISILSYGWASHLDYPRVLSYLSRRGEAFYANQSFNGVANRLLHNGESVVWQEHAFPPDHPVVYLLTLVTSLVLIAAALAIPVWRRFQGTIVDLAAVSIVAVIASPIAWEHHYGVLLPLFAATAPLLLVTRPFGAFTAPALALAYLMTGEFVILPLLRFAGSPLSVLQSHVLAGALLLLVALLQGAPAGRAPAGA